MTEETTTETTTTQETTEPKPSTGGFNRDHPTAQKLFVQLKSKDTEIAELKKQRKDEADAKRENELKASGNYDQLKIEMDADKATDKAAHAAEIMGMKLENALARAGMVNEISLDGAVGRYRVETHGEIDAYVETLKNDPAQAHHFAPLATKAAPTLPNPTEGGAPAGRSQGLDLDKRLAYQDPENPKEAEKIRAEARSEKARTMFGAK